MDNGGADERFRRSTLIEHTRVDLNEFLETAGDKIIHIGRMFPRMTATGPVEFRMGATDTPNGQLVWRPWQIFDDGYAVDFHGAGRYLSYQIRPKDGSQFALSSMDLEFSVVGEQ